MQPPRGGDPAPGCSDAPTTVTSPALAAIEAAAAAVAAPRAARSIPGSFFTSNLSKSKSLTYSMASGLVGRLLWTARSAAVTCERICLPSSSGSAGGCWLHRCPACTLFHLVTEGSSYSFRRGLRRRGSAYTTPPGHPSSRHNNAEHGQACVPSHRSRNALARSPRLTRSGNSVGEANAARAFSHTRTRKGNSCRLE